MPEIIPPHTKTEFDAHEGDIFYLDDGDLYLRNGSQEARVLIINADATTPNHVSDFARWLLRQAETHKTPAGRQRQPRHGRGR